MIASKMIAVWFYIDGEFRSEPQVNDEGTLHTILELRCAAYRCKSAFYEYHGRWALHRPHHPYPHKRTTYYDSREAVEMMVIHGE